VYTSKKQSLQKMCKTDVNNCSYDPHSSSVTNFISYPSCVPCLFLLITNLSSGGLTCTGIIMLFNLLVHIDPWH
jgi:hypothetical protein